MITGWGQADYCRAFFREPPIARRGLPSRPRVDTCVTLQFNRSPTWDDEPETSTSPTGRDVFETATTRDGETARLFFFFFFGFPRRVVAPTTVEDHPEGRERTRNPRVSTPRTRRRSHRRRLRDIGIYIRERLRDAITGNCPTILRATPPAPTPPAVLTLRRGSTPSSPGTLIPYTRRDPRARSTSRPSPGRDATRVRERGDCGDGFLRRRRVLARHHNRETCGTGRR